MQELVDMGFTGTVLYDHKIHRFDLEGKKGNKAGWYVGFLNKRKDNTTFKAIQYGSHREGGALLIFDSKEPLNKADYDLVDKQTKEFEELRLLKYHQAAFEATNLWPNLPPVVKHTYLARKKIQAHGAKLSKGRITLTLSSQDGEIHGLQYIGADGKKFFQTGCAKKGHFYKIKGGKALYITEGFSTGASVAEMTGGTVLVAFDAGNVKHVAKQFPDAIIAGDNDEAGRKACLGYRYVLPDDVGEDWNDLYVEVGKKAAKKIFLEKVASLDTPQEHEAGQPMIKALGYDGDDFYFISNQKPQITRIAASGFTKHTLLSLCDLGFWEARYPAKTSFNLELATNTLMNLCRLKGHFDPHSVRGTGVWIDGKDVVVNCGDHLVINEGQKNLTDYDSKHIYQQGRSIGTHIKTKKPDVGEFLLLLENLSWKQSDSAKLLFGWLAVAPVCGALPWRPHIWITGASGSGKTTVMNEVVGKVIEGYQVMGRSTEAGIRQLIGASAMPLLFDENETTDASSARRVDNVVELFRQASSESKSFVAKGTPSGKGMSYNVRFCAAVSSVNVGLHLEQDANRFTVMELIPNQANFFNETGGIRDQLFDILTEDFVSGWRSWAIQNVHAILDMKDELFNALRIKVNARFAEQYGTMLAGYTTFMGYSAENVVREFNHEDFHIKENNQTDCLAYILQSRIVEGGRSMSIGEIIEASKVADTDGGEKDALLQRYGLRWYEEKLAVSSVHAELSKLMRESNNPRKWGPALARLPGAEGSRTVRIGGYPIKCTLVPLQKD